MKIKIFFIILIVFIPLLLLGDNNILIKTIPSNAGVYWDGKHLGQTPLTIKNNSVIPIYQNPEVVYQIIIYKDFFEGEPINISYLKNGNNIYVIELQYLKRLPFYNGIMDIDYTLNFKQLIGKSKEDLGILRNEIFAKYGRPFKNKKYFSKKHWYIVNPYYNESFLSETDKKNVNLILKFEKPSKADIGLKNKILKNIEYKTPKSNLVLLFSDFNKVIIQKNHETSETTSPYYLYDESHHSWIIFDNIIYIFDENAYSNGLKWFSHLEYLIKVKLDHKNLKILSMKEEHRRLGGESEYNFK